MASPSIETHKPYSYPKHVCLLINYLWTSHRIAPWVFFITWGQFFKFLILLKMEVLKLVILTYSSDDSFQSKFNKDLNPKP
jgi:hypothetical protein